jgi:hypothetical protein
LYYYRILKVDNVFLSSGIPDNAGAHVSFPFSFLVLPKGISNVE